MTSRDPEQLVSDALVFRNFYVGELARALTTNDSGDDAVRLRGSSGLRSELARIFQPVIDFRQRCATAGFAAFDDNNPIRIITDGKMDEARQAIERTLRFNSASISPEQRNALNALVAAMDDVRELKAAERAGDFRITARIQDEAEAIDRIDHLKKNPDTIPLRHFLNEDGTARSVNESLRLSLRRSGLNYVRAAELPDSAQEQLSPSMPQTPVGTAPVTEIAATKAADLSAQPAAVAAANPPAATATGGRRATTFRLKAGGVIGNNAIALGIGAATLWETLSVGEAAAATIGATSLGDLGDVAGAVQDGDLTGAASMAADAVLPVPIFGMGQAVTTALNPTPIPDTFDRTFDALGQIDAGALAENDPIRRLDVAQQAVMEAREAFEAARSPVNVTGNYMERRASEAALAQAEQRYDTLWTSAAPTPAQEALIYAAVDAIWRETRYAEVQTQLAAERGEAQPPYAVSAPASTAETASESQLMQLPTPSLTRPAAAAAEPSPTR